MYERLTDVPQPIRFMFDESMTVPVIGWKDTLELVEGETVITGRTPVYGDPIYTVTRKTGEVKSLGDLARVVDLLKPMEQLEKWYGMYTFGLDQAFVDRFLAWEKAEPSQANFVHDLEPDEDAFNAAYGTWIGNQPFPPEHLEFAGFFPLMDGYSYYMKIQGVEFEGVMCSATAEDMWGLSSIENYVRMGMPTPFKFDNGNKITLTADNIDAFQSIWAPFRASFFS